MTPLEQWLSAATRGLSAESAAQVRAEIQQHYNSACEAGDDAIAALGNPRSANRAYRKVLLTQQEAMLAPVLTQPKQPGVPRMLLTAALLAAIAWFFARKQHDPGFWPLILAIYSGAPVAWFFRPTTLERSRIYTGILGVRTILVTAIAWWFNSWTVGLPVAAIVFLLDYFMHHQRLSIFRKLAAGQTWSLLPEEPRLTHAEAIMLRTLDTEPPVAEKVASTVLLMMVVGVAVWQPPTFIPMAVWIIGAHLTRRALPFCTEEASRWFRRAKWSAMVVAALLPVLYGARIPWAGAIFLAWVFVLFDIRSITIRRKLPIAQWPKRLYW